MPRSLLLLGTVLLLLLAFIASFAIGSAIQRSAAIDNGPLIVSLNGQLQVIDVAGDTVRAIGTPGDIAKGVSRSPDGRLAAYWTDSGVASHLHLIGLDGEGGRELATGRPVQWVPGIDTWSPDSDSLASEVRVGAVTRILVTNVVTGASTLIGPDRTNVHAPLWSPDGQWIAFYQGTSPLATLAVMRPDGSEGRAISGDIGQLDAAGANNWSSDGKWVYYVATTPSQARLFRANVAGEYSQALTKDDVVAGAPALSPDDKELSFIVPNPASGWDLYAAGGEGTGPHLVLAHAENLGWSSDSQDLLALWTPTDRLGGLALVKLDGSDLRVVLPFDAACQAAAHDCVLAVGWGQPRP